MSLLRIYAPLGETPVDRHGIAPFEALDHHVLAHSLDPVTVLEERMSG